jgi:hypothetical protein
MRMRIWRVVCSSLVALLALGAAACGQDTTPGVAPETWDLETPCADGPCPSSPEDAGAAPDARVDSGRADSGRPDASADVGVGSGVDAGRDADADAAYDAAPALRDCASGAQVPVGEECPEDLDSDSDGLDDAEEAALCTDPLDPDTDRDGLGDGDELRDGTDPCAADSDGDGLDDADELYFSLDPNLPDTRGDGVLDGDRYVVTACDTPAAGPLTYTRSAEGDWLIAFSPVVDVKPELEFTTTPPPPGAAFTYLVANGPVVGFVLSEPKRGGRDALGRPTAYHDAVVATAQVLEQDLGDTFVTHDGFDAFTSRYLIAFPTQVSFYDARNALLYAMAGGFGAADVDPPPQGGGGPAAAFPSYRIVVTVIERADRYVVLFALTLTVPYSDEFALLLSGLTDATNVARARDDGRLTCHPRVFTRERGQAATLPLPQVPIMSSLRVRTKRPYQFSDELVPLSDTDGYTYSRDTNTITLHGTYAPLPGGKQCVVADDCWPGEGYCAHGACVYPSDLSFHYEHFIRRGPARP